MAPRSHTGTTTIRSLVVTQPPAALSNNEHLLALSDVVEVDPAICLVLGLLLGFIFLCPTAGAVGYLRRLEVSNARKTEIGEKNRIIRSSEQALATKNQAFVTLEQQSAGRQREHEQEMARQLAAAALKTADVKRKHEEEKASLRRQIADSELVLVTEQREEIQRLTAAITALTARLELKIANMVAEHQRDMGRLGRQLAASETLATEQEEIQRLEASIATVPEKHVKIEGLEGMIKNLEQVELQLRREREQEIARLENQHAASELLARELRGEIQARIADATKESTEKDVDARALRRTIAQQERVERFLRGEHVKEVARLRRRIDMVDQIAAGLAADTQTLRDEQSRAADDYMREKLEMQSQHERVVALMRSARERMVTQMGSEHERVVGRMRRRMGMMDQAAARLEANIQALWDKRLRAAEACLCREQLTEERARIRELEARLAECAEIHNDTRDLLWNVQTAVDLRIESERRHECFVARLSGEIERLEQDVAAGHGMGADGNESMNSAVGGGGNQRGDEL